ncbi:putative repeat protein (TIGR01451 family)/fimbrial isopeptide formation D2 family protein [Archangium gephyra]|uniref:Internalin, putative n=1 Tax=Archangium gephyra TaxID=48 RepID=A0AAC8TIY2_9BACT|nr:OmpA family protein [Archangium gephyra]AKJ07812.1 internalin, putative [Archangium gephyra]REG29564.1 putative repeat protein (TIGR01451 family)/fimbrial isopeptide formation D2 family protein [Archangium gephyra]
MRTHPSYSPDSTSWQRPSLWFWVLWLLSTLTALLVAGPAEAQSTKTPRYWSDQHGNFVLLGNTLAQGCNTETPAPVVGTVGDACGSHAGKSDDTSPDYFWTLQSAAGGEEAVADPYVLPGEARSRVKLELPTGARVTYARIYWAATRSNSQKPSARSPEQPDDTAELTFLRDLPLGAQETRGLTADVTFKSDYKVTQDFQYQASRDVTDFVQKHGPGLYQVGGVDSIDLRGRYFLSEFMFSAWWMVVFYELDSEPMRDLKLYDGLDPVAGADITVNLRGFYVPEHANEAKLGVVAFDGDEYDKGDWLDFNKVRMGNALNPADNFFNSTRSHQPLAAGAVGTPAAVPVSVAGDLPRLTGTQGSLSGLDLDVVDVTMAPGSQTAEVKVGTSGDIYWLGGFVSSIATKRPDFRNTFKTVENLSRTDGTARPGNSLRYTITTVNTGDDDAIDTKFVDTLPAQLTYVAGSLRVNSRPVTDASGDDVGSWDGSTLTVYLGRGATPTKGGEMAMGASATLQFEALVAAGATGTIENVAIINAAGKLGTDAMDTRSRPGPGLPPGPTPMPIPAPGGPDGGSDGGPDGGSDGGPDGGSDGGPDGGSDGGPDGGSDGGPDGGFDGGPDNEVEYVVAGRGCSASSGSPLVWLAALLLAVPLIRSRRRTGTAAAGLVALGTLSAPEAAQAQLLDPATLSQSIDVQRYKPGPGATDLLGVYGARVDKHLGWHLGASLNYANNPLNFLDKRQDDFVYGVVATQVTLDLMGSISFFDRFELGMALPVTYQASESGAAVMPAFAEGVNGAGLGDLRLVPKAHLFSKGGLHLGVAVPVVLPTAGGQGFRGGAGLAVQPQVVGEWLSSSGVRVVANVGAHLRGEQRLSNLRTGNELSYALGARLPVGERLAVQAQLSGALGLAERNAEELPLELLASVQYRVRDGLLAHVGGGPGLTRGYGTPGFRVFAGIDWTQPGERAPAPRTQPIAEAPVPVAASSSVEEVPVAPAAPALIETDPVRPPPDVSRVRLEADRIVILEKVHFATNKDVILDRSFELLKQVASVLKANPRVERVRVEGHTDDRGDDAFNMDLSRRRATNVRAFLIAEGIAAERLEAEGYGETRPMDTNATDAGRENNRRVEFNIEKLAGGPATRPAP